MRRTISPSELYALTPEEVSRNLSSLNGCYYQHIPEVDVEHLPSQWDDALNPNTRVERRILRHVQEDFRRYWELATVWFDNRPVMVVQNAGREGDDYYARFVTDPVAYVEMVLYLLTIAPVPPPDWVDADEQRNDLLSFYWDQMVVPEATP